jgi:hypothetical protein
MRQLLLGLRARLSPAPTACHHGPPGRALHPGTWGGKVRELRFHLLAQQARVTYGLAQGRRVILLTVFRKTRSAEVAEVAGALQAQKTCEAEHGPAHDTFDREAS